MRGTVGSAYDVAVVGAGIVGLATACRLLEARPELRLVVVEKEATVAAHQTRHNSGVIHAGIFHPPGSLKARLCREGKLALEGVAQDGETASGASAARVPAQMARWRALDRLRRFGTPLRPTARPRVVRGRA